MVSGGRQRLQVFFDYKVDRVLIRLGFGFFIIICALSRNSKAPTVGVKFMIVTAWPTLGLICIPVDQLMLNAVIYCRQRIFTTNQACSKFKTL